MIDGREHRHAEAADTGDVACAAVGDDADAAAREHPRRQQLAPERDVETAGGREHDDRSRRRRVDRRQLALVGVLDRGVGGGRGDRERAPCHGRRPVLQRSDAVLHRLRAAAEPVEHVRDHRDRQRRQPRDLRVLAAGRIAHEAL